MVRRRTDKPRRRPLTLVILCVNVALLIFTIAVAGSTGKDCQTALDVEACNVGVVGGVFVMLVVAAVIDVILGVIWVVTKPKDVPGRLCPVCGSPVAVGVTRCGSCGYDYRAAVEGG